MYHDVTELTDQQYQAIDLYLSGKNTGNIAEMLNISRQTLWRWRQLPAFQREHQQAQKAQRQAMRGQIMEVMRLSLVAVARDLSRAENPKIINPIDTALHVLKLLHSAPLLAEPPVVSTMD